MWYIFLYNWYLMPNNQKKLENNKTLFSSFYRLIISAQS